MNLLLHLTLYITETQFFRNTSQHRESNHSEFEGKTKIIDKLKN